MLFIVKVVYHLVLTLIFLYSIFAFKKIKKEGGLLLIIAIFLTFLVEAVGVVTKTFSISLGKKVLWMFNGYSLLIFPIYLLLIKNSLPRRYGQITYVAIAAFLLFGLWDLFFLQGPATFNTYVVIMGACLVIIASLLYFKTRFDNLQEDLLQSWMFWVATGLLMYFTGSLLYFGFLHYLSKIDNNWLIKINLMFQVLNVLLYSIFGVALLCLTRRQK